MKRLALVLAALAPAFVLAQYSYMPYRMMSTQGDPFLYYVDSRSSAVGGVPLGEAQAAADRAWDKWNQVTCAAPKVKSLGLTGSVVVTPGDPANGANVTPVFVTNSNDPDYARALGSPYIAGVTLPLSYSGVLLNCNIFVNAVGFALSTAAVTPSNTIDIETVMLHEAGHCLGIDHLAMLDDQNQQVAMYGAVFIGAQNRVLHGPDVAALCERNPLAGVPASPCYDGGTCDPGAVCYTQTLPAGPKQFCSKACNVTANEACPLPLTCTAATFIPGSNGACLLPSGNVTPVGRACTQQTDCVSAVGTCLPPASSPSGHQYWAAGYCSQSCEVGQPACPAGSTCTTLGDNSKKCLASCRPGLADCRSNYACVLTSKGGVCAPMCFTNADCQDSTVDCRTCDGVCVPKQNPAAQLGDLCDQDTNCGAGQSCLLLAPTGAASKQCTQQCGRGCGMCPTGSSCIATPKGLNCLLSCTGPNTCPQGLRCADFPSAKGCVPVCLQNTDCPVGQSCFAGECLSSKPDSGCGTLCMVTDSGKPIVVTPKDGGIDTTPIRPCGCEASGSSMLSLLIGWALVLLVRRLAWRQ